MVEQLVLHIGTPKTGTTAIQEALVDRYDELLAAGILYPRAGRTPGPGHANLCLGFLGDERYNPAYGGLEELVAEVRDTGARRVLVSSEAFQLGPELVALASTLRERTGARELQVLGYVRPQWERVESSYVERVKTGSTGDSFSDFAAAQLHAPQLDYGRQFEPWRKELGGALTIRRYQRAALVEHDVVADFGHCVTALPPLVPPEGRRSNPRPGARTLEMLRSIKLLLAERELDRGLRLVPVFRRARAEIEDALPGDVPFRALTPELAWRIFTEFRSLNRDSARTLLGEDGDLFGPPEHLESPSSWSLVGATDHERNVYAEVLAHTLERVRRQLAGDRRARQRAGAALKEARRGVRATADA